MCTALQLHSLASCSGSWPRARGCGFALPAAGSLGRIRTRSRSGRVRCRVGETGMDWVSFPKLEGASHRLLSDIAGTMETELGPLLEPSRTPEDVKHFKNAQGNGEGSVTIRAGKEGSKIDFVLGSWLDVELPFGTLKIATLIAMLAADTDAPHLLFEFIQSGPNALVVVLDLLPRKDLVLEPEYLKRIYEDSELDNVRTELHKVPGVQDYVSSSLYVRSIVSPTALLLKIQGNLPSGEPVEGGLQEVVARSVHPNAKKVFLTWLDAFRNKGLVPEGKEKEHLVKRDDMIKTKGVEVDLSSNMPRLFGQEVADRVVAAFRKGQ